MTKNKRILIFGRPGSGKTCLSVLEIIQALKQGYYVYSNIEINWFGDLYTLSSWDKFINKIYSSFFGIFYNKRLKKISKLEKLRTELFNAKENVIFNEYGIPNLNLTNIFYQDYWAKKDIEKLKKRNENCDIGLIREHYFAQNRFSYFENLEEAINCLIKKAEENKENKFMLAFDEGFIELDHSRKVPPFITNFLNQTRKLNCDVVISSQRPIAVYPSYRAICDFMVNVKKGWFNRFSSKLYYVDDNANALPNLEQDKEGNDKGENYKDFKGKEVYPFFDTKQSIGLKKIFSIK